MGNGHIVQITKQIYRFELGKEGSHSLNVYSFLPDYFPYFLTSSVLNCAPSMLKLYYSPTEFFLSFLISIKF